MPDDQGTVWHDETNDPDPTFILSVQEGTYDNFKFAFSLEPYEEEPVEEDDEIPVEISG